MDQSLCTIIVRGAHQEGLDKNITCSREWTVEQLKKKIECVYPGNPEMRKQRLIYAGKLLSDDHQIKHIFKENNQVVHLAYHKPDLVKEKVTVSSKADRQPLPNSQSTSSTTETELRQRFTSNSSNQTREVPAPQINQHSQHNWMYSYPGVGHASFSNNSEAYMQWLQQYQQQYAYLAHYYGYPPQVPHQTLSTPNGQNVENAPADPAQARPNQDMRMNAQGGLVEADDDDEMNRDWLDALFSFTRLGLLMSIIYFYSPVYRFALAIILFVLVYLYQAGVFRLHRRPNGMPAQPPNVNNQQQTDDNNNQRDGAETNENGTEDGATPPPPPPPSVFVTAWHFVRSFFSSLLPTGPPGVVN